MSTELENAVKSLLHSLEQRQFEGIEDKVALISYLPVGHEKIKSGLYIVKDEYEFIQAMIDYINEGGVRSMAYWTVKQSRGNPKEFPSLIHFTEQYRGDTFVHADCTAIKDLTAYLEKYQPQPL